MKHKIGYKRLILALLFLYLSVVVTVTMVIRPSVGRSVAVSNTVTSAVSSAALSSANTGPININTATAEQLITLDGIGPEKAANIIAYRSQNGDFLDISEIMNVSGIGEATYEKIKDNICV